jgi:capsular polysaccharide biosynthesis protein
MLSDRYAVAGLYLMGLRRWWWLPLSAALVAGSVAFLLARRQVPTYAATATAVVSPSAEVQETADLLRSLETLERRTVIATFARLASLRESRRRMAASMGIEAGELSGYSVNASVISSSNLILVRVEGPDPRRAAALADATLAVTDENARRLYRLFTVEQVGAATVASRPIHPDPVRSVGVAVIIGFLLGGLVAAVSGSLPHARADR